MPIVGFGGGGSGKVMGWAGVVHHVKHVKGKAGIGEVQ